MIALLLGAALAAAAALSWLHLRPAGEARAVAVPSVQHVTGPAERRRRLPPLEEPLALGLRLGALALALLGVVCARLGCTGDARAVAVADPASAGACARARTVAGTAAVLCFDGETPRASGEEAARLELLATACSDTRAACLLRAAGSTGRPILVVGALENAEWGPALAGLPGGFAFLRAPPRRDSPAPAAEAPPGAALRLDGRSAAAQVWAAALAEALVRPGAPPPAGGALPGIVVQDAGWAAAPRGDSALTVTVLDGALPPGPAHPAVERRRGTGLVLPDPLDLAAGTAGLGLQTSLAFVPDPRFDLPIPVAAVRRTPAGVELAVAATEEDLGRWAHEGDLVPLARALLAAALSPPASASRPPVGGALGWTGVEGRPAPLGLLDVAPGDYRRSDGRVAFHLVRARAPGTDPLDDRALRSLGGRPWTGPSRGEMPWAAALLGAALGAWLLGMLATRQVRRAWVPGLAVAALLALLEAGAALPAERKARWVAALAVPPGPESRRLEDALGRTSVALEPAPARCAAPGAGAPCALVATVGSASAPPEGADALVFDQARPRVDLLGVDAPGEVPLGSAAGVWATVRIRRAAGLPVLVSVHSTGAAPARAELRVDGPDEVRTVRLSISPLSEGVIYLAAEALVPGEPQAQDGRLLALAARSRTSRRLVLATSPAWEARAATEALDTTGARVDALTLVGSRAVAARGGSPEDPRQVLRDTDRLEALDLLVLVGFSEDLDAAAAAGLRRYVERGGGALLLSSPGAARALGMAIPPLAAAAPERSLVAALGTGETLAFRGYAPSAPAMLLPGTEVLGRLGDPGDSAPLPWLVGRALGLGRVAAATAPDVWRLSPPGRGREAYRSVLRSLVGWLEAPRASRAGVVLSDDWASLRPADASSAALAPLSAPGVIAGLPVDSLDSAALIGWPRARLRAAAARTGHPFLEPDGAEELALALERLPPPPRWTGSISLRSSDAAFVLLAALVVLEALARRLYRRTGGRRANNALSSGDTGGSATGAGRSQRDSATAAARAAAARDGASSAA